MTNVEFPLNILSTSNFAKNTGFKIGLGDNAGKAVMGYWKNNDNKPYIYFKLFDKTATVAIYESTVQITGNTTITGKIDTNTNANGNL